MVVPFNQVKKEALQTLTSDTGDINTLEKKWLFTFTDPYVGAIPDMYREFYRQKGYTIGSNNDRAKRHLNDLGYTGDLHTMWYDYWSDGGEPTAVAATGMLSFNGNVLGDEEITIGSTVYRFVNELVFAYDVLIGASASITINNLIAAVNAAAGEGTVYGTGTVEHPDVTASTTPGEMNVTAKVAGAAGNSIVTTSTSLTATWGAGTLEGGA